MADVTNPLLMEVLGEVLEELGPLFPDQRWHVGGDEPHFACWQANANVSQYMKAHGIDPEGLYAKFEADCGSPVRPPDALAADRRGRNAI